MSEILGTKNLLALMSNRSKKKVKTECLEGSARSGKTISRAQMGIICAANSPSLVERWFRRDGTVAKRALKADLFMLLQQQFPELWNPKNWNDRDAVYTLPTNAPNNAKIYLSGANDPEVLKGVYQDNAWLNEATEISVEAKRQIEARTNFYKTYDWNPSYTKHWLFDEVLSQDPKKYLYVHSTYKDNPYISQEIIDSIEKWEPTKGNIAAGTASYWHWQVYGLGNRAQRPGAIYTNWSITTEWPERMACARYGYGLDFGFSLDPTALIECAFFRDTLYLREIVYETGLITLKRNDQPNLKSIEGRLEEAKISKQDLIWADSAHPGLIAELGVAGYNVIGTNKLPGSKFGYVLTGINRMQQQKIKVLSSSQNLISEFQNYTWKTDAKSGIQLTEPIGDFNHALDAVRGWTMEELTPKRIPDRVRKKNHNMRSNYNPYDQVTGSYQNNLVSSFN